MSGVEIGLGAVAAVGVGTKIVGDIVGANAQADAAKREAALKNQQADELLSRQSVNERIMLEQDQQAEHEFGAAFASTGREGGGIGGMLTIHKNTLDAIANTRRDAEFKAQMIRAGAESDIQLASDRTTASYITGAGTLLSAGAQAYNLYKGPSSNPQQLPQVKP
jgi:hypothetical protein